MIPPARVFATAGRLSATLPAQPGRMIDREDELRDVCERLRRPDVRLVTLTGTAGAGKTRLALAAAENVAPSFALGVCFVDLSPLRDPSLVLLTVARSLGLRERPDPDPDPDKAPLAAIREHLSPAPDQVPGELLLLLDNFEQVLTAAPDLASLLESCPGVTALVTSRAALRLRWEYEVPVPPLGLPDLSRSLPADELVRAPAVALFAQRAQAVRPQLTLDESNAICAAEICIRLDGLPLAIELAAARTRVLPLTTLLARLESRFELLTGGAGDAPARHRALRAAVDWSYDLLVPAEQVAFRRVAVFTDGFSLEAAEALVRDVGDPIELVASLLDKSLIRREGDDAENEPRYHLLETLREYGLEQLAAHGEARDVRERHARFFCALAERAAVELDGTDQARWLTLLELEHANLQAALDWAFAHAEPELGVRLASALGLFWSVRGHLREGSGWLRRALDTCAVQPAARARLLIGAGLLLRERSEYAQAGALFDEALTLFRELADRRGMADAFGHLGEVARYQGDFLRASDYYLESLELHRATGNQRGVSGALVHLGVIARNQGDYDRALALYEQSLVIDRELGDMRGMAITLNNLGAVSGARGDHAGAGRLFEASLALRRELGDKRGIALGLKNLGDSARYLSDYDRAAALYQESLALRRELGDPWGLALCLEGLAAVAILRADPQRGTRLSSVAARLRQTVGAPLPPSERDTVEEFHGLAREALGPGRFEVEWTVGDAMGIDDALEFALATPEPSPEAAPPAARDVPGLLTPREREVVTRIAAGWTNREIAAELIVSERTVDAHVDHIRDKLGVRSRAQIATWAVANGLAQST